MSTSEVRINSKFNSQGIDQAKNGLKGLQNTSTAVAHNLSAGFENIKMGNLNDGIRQISTGFKGLGTALPVLGLATGALAGLGAAVKACVTEFSNAELVNVRFENSLKALNLTAYSKQFSDFASNMQNYTGISDEVIKDTIQIGLQMGISVKDIERVTKVAADMSATFGTDLRTNVELLAKAQEGQTTQLTRMLPSLKDAIKDGASFADVLGAVESKTNGAAAAAGGTFKGTLDKLKESFGDLKENLGAVLIPALEGVLTVLTNIIKALAKITTPKPQIDKEIEEKQAQIESKKYDIASATDPELKAIFQQQLNDLENQLAVLKAQKKASDEQNAWQKAQAEKDEKNKDKNKNVLTTEIKTEPVVYDFSATEAENEHYHKKVEEYFTEALTQLETNKNLQMQTQEAPQNLRPVEEAFSTFRENMQQTNRILLDAGDVLRNKFMVGLSSILNIDLSSPEAFLMSLFQQTQSFQMLGRALQPIINMLDAFIMPLLQMMSPILSAVFKATGEVMKVLLPPVFQLVGLIMNLVKGIISLGQTIWYIVSFQWSKLGSVQWSWTSAADTNATVQAALAAIDAAQNQNPLTGTTNQTTTTTYAASGARDIYVNINYYDSYVNGDAREIALNIRNEIRLAEAMGL